jgi:hypothetical protein
MTRPAPVPVIEPTAVPVRMPDPAVREHPAHGTSGFLGLAGGLLLVLAGAGWRSALDLGATGFVVGGLLAVAGLVALGGSPRCPPARRRCCSSSAATPAPSAGPGCAGSTR